MANEASIYANNIVENTFNCIRNVQSFDLVFKDDIYLEPIEEELVFDDSSDSDIIFPDMDYLNRLD